MYLAFIVWLCFGLDERPATALRSWCACALHCMLRACGIP